MADLSTCLPLTRESVQQAHTLIKSHIHYTPVLTNATLTHLASTPRATLEGTRWAAPGRQPARPQIRLWFKCENLQRIGAFKVRGAFHAVARLQREDQAWLAADGLRKGVVTHSSGNHAQALALAAHESGLPAYIVMPEISAAPKVAATKGYGAQVLFSGSTSVEREAVAAQVIRDTGARMVPPYDHPDIILGQGTMGLEFQEQVERLVRTTGAGAGEKNGALAAQHDLDSRFHHATTTTSTSTTTATDKTSKSKGLDAIITPCGGGGMLSGVALSCEGTGIAVFGAEPSFQGADDAKRGFEAGQRIEKVSTLTIADGLRTPVGALPWSVIYERQLVRAMYSVTEDEIRAALRLVLERMKLVVEPSAVVPLAVVLFDEDFRALVEREAGEEGWDVGVVFSGGNVALENLGKMFAPSS